MITPRLHALLDEHLRLLTLMGSKAYTNLRPGRSEGDIRSDFDAQGIPAPQEAVDLFSWREGANRLVPLFYSASLSTLKDTRVTRTGQMLVKWGRQNYGIPPTSEDEEPWKEDFVILLRNDQLDFVLVKAYEPSPRPVYYYCGGRIFRLVDTFEEAVEVATYGLTQGWYWVDPVTQLIMRVGATNSRTDPAEVPDGAAFAAA